jgi:hypothetical protein
MGAFVLDEQPARPAFKPMPTIIIPPETVPEPILIGSDSVQVVNDAPIVSGPLALTTMPLMNFSAFAIPGNAPSLFDNQSNGYRPPQWSGGPSADSPQLVYIPTNMNGLFFDAVLRVHHTTSLRKTEHPVQTGADITDHSYVLPDKITLEIGMSDSMDTLIPGQYEGGVTKSISAYQTFVNLQKQRIPFTLVTRLNMYDTMLITSIDADDDFRTSNALKCIITLEHIFLAQVQTTTSSSRAQTTDSTNKGTEQSLTPNQSNTGILGEGNPTIQNPLASSNAISQSPAGTLPADDYFSNYINTNGSESSSGQITNPLTNQSITNPINQNAIQQSMTGTTSYNTQWVQNSNGGYVLQKIQ